MAYHATSVLISIAIFAVYTQAVRHELELSPNFHLSWEIVDKLFLDFVATVKTSGWVGLALNSKPKMDGADLVIGGIENGTNYLFNYRASGHSLIQKDGSNWKVGSVAFLENANQTVVSFRRPLDTGDADVIAVENSDLYLLWAYGEDDNVKKKHISNGSIKINLINYQP